MAECPRLRLRPLRLARDPQSGQDVIAREEERGEGMPPANQLFFAGLGAIDALGRKTVPCVVKALSGKNNAAPRAKQNSRR